MKNPKYCPLYRNSDSKEIGLLAQGIPCLVEGTNTIFFINKKAVPTDKWRDVAYGRIVVDYRPEKTDTYQNRIKVEGDKVNYSVDCGTLTVDLTTLEILFNSNVLTLNVKFMKIYGKDFYEKL